MRNKLFTILATTTLLLGLAGCGETDEEKLKKQTVKAQALGCITTDQAVEHQQSFNQYTQQEIDVCLTQNRNQKTEVRQQQRHEENMAYYQADMLNELDDISENLRYGVSRPMSPIQPGSYANRIGDTSCGYWLGGYWNWYDDNSRCANQTRHYNDYMVMTGVYTPAHLLSARQYSYYNTYRTSPSYRSSVNVNGYYGISGKVIDKSRYTSQNNTYTKSYSTWSSKRDTYRKSPSYTKALKTAKKKDTKWDAKKVSNNKNKFKSSFSSKKATNTNTAKVTKTNVKTTPTKTTTASKSTQPTSKNTFKSSFSAKKNTTKKPTANTNNYGSKKTVKTYKKTEVKQYKSNASYKNNNKTSYKKQTKYSPPKKQKKTKKY
jgi:hypothetical protein